MKSDSVCRVVVLVLLTPVFLEPPASAWIRGFSLVRCAAFWERSSWSPHLLQISKLLGSWKIRLPNIWLVKYSMATTRYRLPPLLSEKGSAILMAILSKGPPTLYLCVGSRVLVLEPPLTAQLSHILLTPSTSPYNCSQMFRCLTFSMVFLAPSCPPSCQTGIIASTSFILLGWMTIWSVLDISSADSQWRYSKTSLTSREFHYVQMLF